MNKRNLIIILCLLLSILVGIIVPACAPVATSQYQFDGSASSIANRAHGEVVVTKISSNPEVYRVWDVEFYNVCYVSAVEMECK